MQFFYHYTLDQVHKFLKKQHKNYYWLSTMYKYIHVWLLHVRYKFTITVRATETAVSVPFPCHFRARAVQRLARSVVYSTTNPGTALVNSKAYFACT